MCSFQGDGTQAASWRRAVVLVARSRETPSHFPRRVNNIDRHFEKFHEDFLNLFLSLRCALLRTFDSIIKRLYMKFSLNTETFLK